MFVKNPHGHGRCEGANEKRRQHDSSQKPQDSECPAHNSLWVLVTITKGAKQQQIQLVKDRASLTTVEPRVGDQPLCKKNCDLLREVVSHGRYSAVIKGRDRP